MSSETEKLVGELRAIAEAARRPDGTHCPLSETIARAADALEAKDHELAARDEQLARACADHATATIGWEKRGLVEAAEARIAEQNARIAEMEGAYEDWRPVSESPHPEDIRRGSLLNFYRASDEGTWWNGTWGQRRDADIWCPLITARLNDRARSVLGGPDA